MIELFFIYLLCQGIGEHARRKRRKALTYQALAVVPWIGFEVIGSLLGAWVHTAFFGEPSNPFLSLAWVVGILSGATAGGSVLLVLKFLPEAPIEVRLRNLPNLPPASTDRSSPPAWRQNGAEGYLAYLIAGTDPGAHAVLCFSGIYSFDFREPLEEATGLGETCSWIRADEGAAS